MLDKNVFPSLPGKGGVAAPSKRMMPKATKVGADGVVSPRNQKCTFNASCSTRGSPADVIDPKPGEPKTVLGFPSGGELVKLKASARNSTAIFSLRGILFSRPRSRFRSPGPRTGFLELFPSVNCAASTNASVSK